MKKVAFQTLGCRLNQYETDALITRFLDGGYQVVPFEDKADAYIINTCTVTNKGDRKSRNMIHRGLRTRGNGLVLVTGCYAESSREELEKSGIDYLVGNQQKNQIYALVDAHFRGEIPDLTRLPGDLFDFGVPDTELHTRSLIKIQDGCDNFCTFCIIPHVRGRAQSRNPQEILENVRRALAAGFRELVLTGVNISRYHWGDLDFTGLLRLILEIPGDFRIRITSLEPEHLGDGFLNLLDHPKLCPHLHLCLQSGSQRILLAMRREYSLEDFRTLVRKIRQRKPGFHLTTDMIVGFPGETIEDHQASLKALEEFSFGHVHIFPYSRRTGTRADRMAQQINDTIKNKRSREMQGEMVRLKRAYRVSLLGSEQRVLAQTLSPEGLVQGYGEHYVPVKFYLENPQRSQFRNQWFRVVLKDLEEGDDPAFIGEVVSQGV